MGFALLMAAASKHHDDADPLRHRHLADHLSTPAGTHAGQWWFAGLVMSVVNLVSVWIVVGGIWWSVLGYPW